MMTPDCDILIAGAGPAGSSAALTAAQEGVRVMVAERRTTVGVPVRCAEYIPRQLLGELDKDRRFVVQPIHGMRTYLRGRLVRETTAPGITIRRDLFDQSLAERAGKAGAEIRAGTRVMKREGDRWLLRGPDGRVFRVSPRVVIGADGPHSTVGRCSGMVNGQMIPAIQAEVALTRPSAFTEVHFCPEIYGGYAWLFPKGKVANVGLGLVSENGGPHRMKPVLFRFLERLRQTGKIAGYPLRWMGGWIPAKPMGMTSGHNVLLAGDAAGQVHPITGAGVPQAVLCGRMAGKWAARAVLQKNPDLLKEYDREWREAFGGMLDLGSRRRRELEAGWDRLEEILPSCWIAFKDYYARS